MNTQMDKVHHKFFEIGLWILALGMFTSISFTGLSHVFLIPAGCWALYRQKFSPIPKSGWALLALILIAALSLIANYDNAPFSNVLKQKYFLTAFLVPFSFHFWFQEKSDAKSKVRSLLQTFLIVVSVATISGLIGLYSGFNPLKFKTACHPDRACGLYGMYMTYGYGIHFFVLALAGLLINYSKVKDYFNKNILIIALVINTIGLYLAYARGALISFLICLPLFFVRKNKLVTIALGLALIVGAVGAFSFAGKFQAMFTAADRKTSVIQRISLYKTAWVVFKEKPLLGIGYKNFEPNVLSYKKKYNLEEANPPFAGHAHNNFLEALASTGLLGFLALVLFHLFWFIEMWQRRDAIGEVCWPIIVALFISGQSQYTLGDGSNLFLITLIYSISQIRIRPV